MGKLTAYDVIAKDIGNQKVSRALETAIGNNPVAVLTPCHQVIQTSGHFGSYMWGTMRNTAIIGWERGKTHAPSKSLAQYTAHEIMLLQNPFLAV